MESNQLNARAMRAAVSKIPAQIDAISRTLEEYLGSYPFNGDTPDGLINDVIGGHAKAQLILNNLRATVAALPQLPPQLPPQVSQGVGA